MYLCLFERLPYILAIIIISLVLITKKFEKLIFILLTLIFISSTILSFYHLGIEQGFFEESFVCLASPDQSKLSSDELLKQLENMPVSCKNVDFKIFGLSLATINLIVSFILSIISIKKFLNYENR
jgi:Disulfide bond formation protein DsbB